MDTSEVINLLKKFIFIILCFIVLINLNTFISKEGFILVKDEGKIEKNRDIVNLLKKKIEKLNEELGATQEKLTRIMFKLIETQKKLENIANIKNSVDKDRIIKIIPGKIVYIRNKKRSYFIINKGKRDNINKGDIVVKNKNLIGKVLYVYNDISICTYLLDISTKIIVYFKIKITKEKNGKLKKEYITKNNIALFKGGKKYCSLYYLDKEVLEYLNKIIKDKSNIFIDIYLYTSGLDDYIKDLIVSKINIKNKEKVNINNFYIKNIKVYNIPKIELLDNIFVIKYKRKDFKEILKEIKKKEGKK